MARTVAILGSTGSIGTSALDVCRAAAGRFRVVLLASGRNVQALAAQVAEFRPRHVVVQDPSLEPELRRLLPPGGDARVYAGPEGLLEAIRAAGADAYLLGISGAACLPASLAVAALGRRLALANKESVVMAGPLLMEEVRRHSAEIVPVDSEHSALFQALGGAPPEDIRRLHLTSSGGPFRTLPPEALARVTWSEAVQHPTWSMGEKISVDSATMMNKALEIVEARWLFDVPADRIHVVVHPQSIVHSMVEFVDGSILAQAGVPDMRVPIRYALGYPERVPADHVAFDFEAFRTLEFLPPDPERFPALRLGFEAARVGGTLGAVLNAANEEAVELFRRGRLPFPGIAAAVEAVMQRHQVNPHPDLAAIQEADRWAREEIHI